MRAALAPVKAGTAERPRGALAFIGEQNAQGQHPRAASVCQPCRIAVDLDRSTGNQSLRDADAKLTGKMIVAGPGHAQGCVLWPGPARRSSQDHPARYLHDAFDHPRHLGAGKAMIPVAALPFDRDQPDRGQPAKVATGRLRADSGHLGQLCRGQRTAIHQGCEHGRSGGVAHRCRNLGNPVRCGHAHPLTAPL